MEKIVIELMLALVLAVSAMTAYIFYRSKKIDSKLEEFYNAVDRMRHSIHKVNSVAEYREVEIDIDYLEETFSGMISEVVLKKEIKLLRLLINKKNRKAK